MSGSEGETGAAPPEQAATTAKEEFEFELNGMTCDSCERLIERVARQNSAEVVEIDARAGRVVFRCEERQVAALTEQLARKGFSEKGERDEKRGDPARLQRYIESIIAGHPGVRVESRLLNYALGAVALLTVLASGAYGLGLLPVASMATYGPILFLAIAASVMVVFSYYHMMTYRKEISCMSGMMAGMTLGMVSGFLAGALVGATNGMFIGSVAGLAVGGGLGVAVGRCCGVMGAMEGIMAGLMAGLMGAMTSLMLLNDHLVAFLYLLFGVSAIVLGGLSYMMYREVGPAPELKVNWSAFLMASAYLAIGLIAMMLYGPRGPIVYV